MRKILIVLCLIISLSFVGCVKSLDYQDFEIVGYEWNSIDGQPPFHMNDLSGQIVGSFILKVKMNRNDICLAIYDNNTDTDDFIAKPHSIVQNPFNCKDRKSIFSGWAGSKNNKLGLSEISVYNILFDNMNYNKELDVCASLYVPFNMSSQGVICKKLYVPPPKIDVDIIPKELLFIQNKEAYFLFNNPQQEKTIIITNTGETVMDFDIFVPGYFRMGSFIINNPNIPYYYAISDKKLMLLPGENISVTISMSARSTDFDKENNPRYVAPGTYETEGYVYSLSQKNSEPKFKKTFKLKTIIIE